MISRAGEICEFPQTKEEPAVLAVKCKHETCTETVKQKKPLQTSRQPLHRTSDTVGGNLYAVRCSRGPEYDLLTPNVINVRV